MENNDRAVKRGYCNILKRGPRQHFEGRIGQIWIRRCMEEEEAPASIVRTRRCLDGEVESGYGGPKADRLIPNSPRLLAPVLLDSYGSLGAPYQHAPQKCAITNVRGVQQQWKHCGNKQQALCPRGGAIVGRR